MSSLRLTYGIQTHMMYENIKPTVQNFCTPFLALGKIEHCRYAKDVIASDIIKLL